MGNVCVMLQIRLVRLDLELVIFKSGLTFVLLFYIQRM